jgi:hypoxanthine phosphoribosyltransferase
MKKKVFVAGELVRNNGLRLAHKLYMSGYWPAIMYVCLRGGAYLGNIINEYYK